MSEKTFADETYEWYLEHEEHVNKLIKNETFAYRPSLEDYYRPNVWKAGHWLWLFEERKRSKNNAGY